MDEPVTPAPSPEPAAESEHASGQVSAPAEVRPHPPASSAATISWLRDLMVSVLIAAVVILFLYQPVRVEGTSMMPGLIDQERIFINKFAYRFDEPLV